MGGGLIHNASRYISLSTAPLFLSYYLSSSGSKDIPVSWHLVSFSSNPVHGLFFYLLGLREWNATMHKAISLTFYLTLVFLLGSEIE